MMPLFRGKIEAAADQFARRVAPFNHHQVSLDCLPDLVLRTGSGDFWRPFRPWRGSPYDEFITPAVLHNPLLLRQKLYHPLKMRRLTLPSQGDVFEVGAESSGGIPT